MENQFHLPDDVGPIQSYEWHVSIDHHHEEWYDPASSTREGSCVAGSKDRVRYSFSSPRAADTCYYCCA